MTALRVGALLALLSFPFALADAGDPGARIPILCLLLGVPHLLALFTTTRNAPKAIGFAGGSACIFMVGFTFDFVLSLIELFPVSGKPWPWMTGAMTHLVLLAAAIDAGRRTNASRKEVGRFALWGVAYSIVSIVAVQVVAKI